MKAHFLATMTACLCALLLAACDGIGTSVRGSFELYGDGTTPSASGSSSDVSAGHFSTGDLLALSTAGDAETIVQLFLGVKGRDASSPVGMVTVSLPAAVIKLPAGGRVTLTITGGGLNYEDTAEASDDGMIYFQVPKVQSGSVVKVSLTVKKANGRLYCSGSETRTVSEDSNNFDIALKYEPIPVSMLTGLQINAALKGAFSVTAGGTARSFRPSQTPPPAGTLTTLLSAPDSECELFAWQEGDAILFYAEGMEGDGKIPLSADSRQMFDGCGALMDMDLSAFDTAGVTTARDMFRNCNGLTNLNLDGWDTSSLENMAGMFNGCSSLNTLDLSGWDTSKVSAMNSVFNECNSLTSLILNGWDTGNVTNMNWMFKNCSNLRTLDLSSWNTSKVTIMTSMFNGCSGLTSVNLGGLNVDSVTNLDYMFYDCSCLETINFEGWNPRNATNLRWMFRSCSNLKILDLSSWKTSCAEDVFKMFSNCSKLEKIYVSSALNLAYILDLESNYMFEGCSSLVGGAGTSFSTNNPTDKRYAHIDGGTGNPGYFTSR